MSGKDRNMEQTVKLKAHHGSGMRETRADRIFNAVNMIIMLLIVIIMLYPLYYTVIVSFSDPYLMLRGEIFLYIKGLTLDSYKYMFEEKLIWTGYLNSIINTAVGTLYALALTIPCAYAMSRRDIKGKGAIMSYFVFTMYFGGGMIPSYILIKQLNLLDTRWALIIPAGFSVYNMIIARTFYQSNIPDELYEAARIDGASEFRTFFSIVLPLSGAIIAVIALYVAVGHWNSYFSALIYISDKNLYPLQMVLRAILVQSQQLRNIDPNSVTPDELVEMMRKQMLATTMKYALIIISSLPMLMVYPFVQKHFVKGVMIGALKG